LLPFNKTLMPFYFLTLIRPLQWLKNLLLFIPLLLSHQLNDSGSLYSVIMGFLTFSFLASAIYAINDLSDIQSDRLHYRKKTRPLASGVIRKDQGIIVAVLMLSLSVGVAIASGVGSYYLVLYFVLNLIYSVYLKKIILIDVILLTFFYILRILYGGSIAKVEVSPWLLVFSFFIFTSLAALKRYSELRIQNRISGLKSSSGRGYSLKDLNFLKILGVVTGFTAIVVYVLYIVFAENVSLYSRPYLLWAIGVILFYWMSRLWRLAFREQLDDDPVGFAFTDIVSLICGAMCLILGGLAE
jgi:4-hydroxybenzoate polyprenyltransferase